MYTHHDHVYILGQLWCLIFLQPLSLGDSVIKLPYDYFVGKDLYATPTKGSSLKQFLLMVDGLLEKKLGPGDHSQLLQYITDMANVNGNVEVISIYLETHGSVVVSTPAYHAADRGSNPARTRRDYLVKKPGSLH